MKITIHTFKDAQKYRDEFYANADDASKKLNALANSAPKGPMGLTAEHIRLSPEYRALSAEYDRWNKAVRQVNSHINKHFKKEHRAEIDARRAEKWAGYEPR